MRLLLVRHGQTPSNVAGAIDTALPGPGLTDLGHRQARALPGALPAGIAGLYASPALRARLTAEPLAADRALGLRTLEGVQEIQAGDAEMGVEEWAVRQYLETIGAWVSGDLEHRMPGAETGAEVLGRMDDALGRVVAEHGPDDTVMVVSHGALIRTWATIRARNIAPGFIRHNSLGNTGVVDLRTDPADDAGWVCTTWMGAALGGPGVDDGDPWDGPTGAPLDAAEDPFER